jgi:AcrR family transcriptional regulator
MAGADRGTATRPVATPTPPTRRRRSPRQLEESARNKATIVAAATEEFAARGYTETSLESIARRVGLTRQGVLHHFSSKEQLFLEVLEEQRRWADSQVVDVPDGDAASALRALSSFLGYSERSLPHLSLVHVLEGEAISGNTHAHGYAIERLAKVRQQLRARLTSARRTGELQPSADVATAATLVAAAINGLQTQRLLDPTVDTRPAFDLLLQLLLSSHAAPGTFTTD